MTAVMGKSCGARGLATTITPALATGASGDGHNVSIVPVFPKVDQA